MNQPDRVNQRYLRLRSQDYTRILICLACGLFCLFTAEVEATVYEVGPGKKYSLVEKVPWESLVAGDEVQIHWRAQPYHTKWVLCRRGTKEKPIVVKGIPSEKGELPVIDGRRAMTRP